MMPSNDADEPIGREVPRWLRPALALYGLVGAVAIESLLRTARSACRVEIAGSVLTAAPRVYCYWHGDALLGFVFALGREVPFAALCHPTWPLKPWEVLARWHHWHLVPGSTGHDGRLGAARIVDCLRDGCSTFVCPDGPAGPPRELKKGALHIAARAVVPIVPLRFECSHALTLRGWDRMRIPLPFSTITVRVGDAIVVSESTLDACSEALARAMG